MYEYRKDFIEAYKKNANKKDYPEDFEKENGMYSCICKKCESVFMGYKRRSTCKECMKKD
jgi:hypothetical protein